MEFLQGFQPSLTGCLRHFRQVFTVDPNVWVFICTEPKPLEFYISLLKTSLHAATCSSLRHCLLGVRVTFTYTCSAQGAWEANCSPAVPPLSLSVNLWFPLYGLCKPPSFKSKSTGTLRTWMIIGGLYNKSTWSNSEQVLARRTIRVHVMPGNSASFYLLKQLGNRPVLAENFTCTCMHDVGG